MTKIDYGDNIDQQEFYGFHDEPKKPNGHASDKEFQLFGMNDLLNLPIPQWDLRDLLFKGQIAFAYGPSQSLKSFIMLDLASRKVHGMDWQGRPLKPCNVVYVAGEGFPLFGARRRAWFKFHEMALENDGLFVLNQAVNLLDDHEVEQFIALASQVDDLGLTILDTWSTCVAGQDENSSLMAKAIENIKRISRALDCSVVVVHHPGKDASRGLRGHSSLLGNADAVWEVERLPGNVAKLTVSKQKDAENGKEFWFQAHRVTLNIYDDEGVELDSLAITSCDKPAPQMSTQMADRIDIARIMDYHSAMSTRGLAQRLMPVIHMGLRKTIDRINDALPANEWVRTRRTGDEVCELCRHVPDKQGRPAKITMRNAAIHLALT